MNDLIVTVAVEPVDDPPDERWPNGEGWFECRVCGLHAGFDGHEAAQVAADGHDTIDCAEELAGL